MQDQPLGSDLNALIEKYEACQGYGIRDEMLEFGRGFRIFTGNYHDLRKELDRAKNPQLWPSLWDEKKKYERDRFNTEIARLLLNFATAAKALVDNTRNFMNGNYTGTNFRKAYQEHIAQKFASDPLVQFIHNLRNYMLHKSFFAAEIIKIESEEGLMFMSYVALMPIRLRAWNEWQAARPYVEALDDKTSLQDVIDLYWNKVMETWKWYGVQLGQENREALVEMAKLEDRIRELDPHWESGYGATYTAKSSSA